MNHTNRYSSIETFLLLPSLSPLLLLLSFLLLPLYVFFLCMFTRSSFPCKSLPYPFISLFLFSSCLSVYFLFFLITFLHSSIRSLLSYFLPSKFSSKQNVYRLFLFTLISCGLPISIPPAVSSIQFLNTFIFGYILKSSINIFTVYIKVLSVCIIFHACHMSHPSQTASFDHHNNIF